MIEMGVSKTDLFTEEQNRISDIAKALAHPARIAIVQYLIRANACINGQLVDELGLAQATISQHLRELKNADIITGTIEGKKISYCINKNKWLEIKEEFQNLFDRVDVSECC